jgi:hypothetical protein
MIPPYSNLGYDDEPAGDMNYGLARLRPEAPHRIAPWGLPCHTRGLPRGGHSRAEGECLVSVAGGEWLLLDVGGGGVAGSQNSSFPEVHPGLPNANTPTDSGLYVLLQSRML